MGEPSAGATAVAGEWFERRAGDSPGDQTARAMHDQLAGDVDRLAIQPAVADLERERDGFLRALNEASLRFAANDTEGVRQLLCDVNAQANADGLTDTLREERDAALARVEELRVALAALAAVHASSHQSDELLRRRVGALSDMPDSYERAVVEALLGARAALEEK